MNRQQYADTIILISGGKVHNDPSNVLGMVAWMQQEGSRARWNPFDTSLAMPGSTDLPGNPDHVQQYVTLESGLRAFFLTLQRGVASYGYGEILAALQEGGCACAVVEAVARSEWGTWRGNPSAATADMLATEKNFSVESQKEVV